MGSASEQQVVGLVAAVALVVLITCAVLYYRTKQTTAKWEAPPAPKPPVMIAWMNESVHFTGGGVVCILMLVLTQIGVMLTWSTAKSAVQEAAIGTIWIASNVLWGIGVICGRRRTYRIMRDPNPPQS